jgi:hypothetical protein
MYTIADIPDILSGYEYKPAYAITHNPKSIRPFKEVPVGIVIHSGDMGPGTAEFAWMKECKFFAQMAWWASKKKYVFTGPLNMVAPHAGAGYNDASVGIEMPGPYNGNREYAKEKTIQLVKDLKEALPFLMWITGHQFINDGKRDPGPFVKADWWEGLGLDVRWKRWRL